jgi:hypothetical protein
MPATRFIAAVIGLIGRAINEIIRFYLPSA